nr:SIR2 family protein [Komagataeibacter oboediens]
MSELSDFPSLQQLARAIWHQNGRGAAAIVGAGMSKCASLASETSLRPPLWRDLACQMVSELYPHDENNAPYDALRLAEEYRQYFGQSALDEFIRRNIEDEAWIPSETHNLFLSLPWSDILTTNYDTLLERASRKSVRNYQYVLSESDLSHAKAPRIVKLHGSIGTTSHFVICEEDFRTYPTKYAAFVNLARQVFVENELVLLGFSGDDPNFLAWAGWVRDHLGSSARRIYLAGALNLSASKRKFLESRNIAPIDLYELVKDYDSESRHRMALNLMFEHLRESEPTPLHEWEVNSLPVSSPEFGKDILFERNRIQGIIDIWEKERHSYPGWIICPGKIRSEIRNSLSSLYIKYSILDDIENIYLLKFMVNISWRYRISFSPMDEILLDVIHKKYNSHKNSIKSVDKIVILRCLLWQAFIVDDKARFEDTSRCILEISDTVSDARAEISYFKAVNACIRMEFKEAHELADSIIGIDPFWKVKKASILSEVGFFGLSENVLRQGIAELRERLWADRTSIWIQSRLAWAECFERAFEQSRFKFLPWSEEKYRQIKSDPFLEVNLLREKIWKETEDISQRRIPRFEPGVYFDPDRVVRISSGVSVKPFAELDLMLTDAGMPPRLSIVSCFSADRRKALQCIKNHSESWYLHCIRVLDDKKEYLDIVMSRVDVAILTNEVWVSLEKYITNSINYWTDMIEREPDYATFYLTRRKIAIRILARLVIRMNSSDAERVYQFTINLCNARSVRPGWAEACAELLKNAWSAIAPERRPFLVADTLSLAITDGHWGIDPIEWIYCTEPSIALSSNKKIEWIESAISSMDKGDPRRPFAILRLLYIRKSGPLQILEHDFLEKIWSVVDDGQPSLPGEATIRIPFWCEITKLDGSDIKEDVRDRLFHTSDIDPSRLSSIQMAIMRSMVLPLHNQAVELFDYLIGIDLSPMYQEDSKFIIEKKLSGYSKRYMERSIGLTLACISKCLTTLDKTCERVKEIEKYLNRTHAVGVAAALLWFPDSLRPMELISKTIRRAFQSKAEDDVSDASWVTEQWLGIEAGKEISGDLSDIAEVLVSAIEFRRTSSILYLIKSIIMFVSEGKTTEEQNSRLDSALGDLLDEWSYNNIENEGEESGIISLVREECVRLAYALNKLDSSYSQAEKWLSEFQNDPLPEVRFALSNVTC